MRKIWLYVDDKDQLRLNIYDKKDEDKIEHEFRGRQCYKYIEKFCNGRMKNRVDINSNDTELIYNGYSISIFGLEEVLEKNGTKPILEDIQIYECIKNANKIKKKKVQRKNKHVKVKIAATGLILAVLSGTVMGNIGNKKYKAEDPNINVENEVDDLIDNLVYDEEETQEEIINLVDEETNNKVVVKLNYNDKSDEQKAYIARSYYGETISKYAEQYGIDPVIMIAIATQERGIHSEDKDKGGATGLMQIQNNSWKNKELTAFNYNTNQNETIIVDEDSLSDVYYNIKVGCMIFQNNMKEMKNNVIAAIQCYNMGYPNMKKVLEAYSNQTGKSVTEILLDINDYGWLDYRNVVEKGDDMYVENVVRWIGENADLGTYNSNGEDVDIIVTSKTK